MFSIFKKEKSHKRPTLFEAIITFLVLIILMIVCIKVYETDPHIPMMLGVVFASLMALHLGYSWTEIENSMISGITKAMQAIIILAIIGILVGVWIVSGVVPTMIYYGLKIISPSAFLVCALIICSITALGTGTSWGTVGTMGIALVGIAEGLGIPAPLACGAIISGAYFGDKMSPLSETTNLAPAMAGTNVFTHIKFMMKSTVIAYGICLAAYLVIGLKYNGGGPENLSAINKLTEGISGAYTVNPILLIPPIVVIVAIALKVPAMPGITLGVISAGILMPFFQDVNFGELLDAAFSGAVSDTGNQSLDKLLSKGGLMSMMPSIALTIIAMMFGGIVEETKQLDVIVKKLLKLIKTPFGLINLTQITCVISNATMPEQYISLVVPGRMYEDSYKQMNLAPESLSNALESSGTVTSVLIPYNTCGVYISGVLGVATLSYAPYAFFNWLMPITVFILSIFGVVVKYREEGEHIEKV